MKNILIAIIVLCLSQASTQGIFDDLLCKKLGLLEGCDVGGLAADPSPAKDDVKADLGTSAEKLPGDIKGDFEAKDSKGRGKRGRNDDDYEREFDGFSHSYGGRGSDIYRRWDNYANRYSDDYERYGREYRHGNDHSRRQGRNSYSVYRRSLPKRKVLLRRGDYGKDYSGDYGNVDYSHNGYGSSRDFNDFGNYNHRRGTSYNYEY